MLMYDIVVETLLIMLLVVCACGSISGTCKVGGHYGLGPETFVPYYGSINFCLPHITVEKVCNIGHVSGQSSKLGLTQWAV